MSRILWLEHAAADAAPAAALRGAGFRVVTAAGNLASVAAARPDLVVCHGPQHRPLLRELRAEQSAFGDLPVVMLAPEADRNAVIAARLEGADDVLPGPADSALLLAVVASRLRQVARVRAAARSKVVAAAVEPLSRNQFSRRALDAARAVAKDGQLAVRLVEVGATIALDENEVVDALRDLAHDGATATAVADNRFAVLMDVGAPVEQVRERVDRVAGVDGAAQVGSLAIGGMPEGEVMSAVSHVLRNFARNGRPQDFPATLNGAFARMVQDATGRLKDFRSAVDRRAYRLAYQPITRLADGRAHHHEALVRFNVPGMENTGEVIAFAEQVGLIGRLDLSILDYALAVLQSSQTPSAARIAVNLSGQTVQSAEAMRPILERLAGRRGAAKRLQVEITESAEIADLAAANAMVQQIRELGFQVFLDDFGAGAASFQYLHAMKVDGVKIDGRYVRNLAQSGKDATMLRGIVRLARDLGLATVAECVETAEQARLLADIGVDYGQGWHFGKPAAELVVPEAPKLVAV